MLQPRTLELSVYRKFSFRNTHVSIVSTTVGLMRILTWFHGLRLTMLVSELISVDLQGCFLS